MPLVVDVSFAKGKERNIAAGAPGPQYTRAATTSSGAGRHRGTWRRPVVSLLLEKSVDVQAVHVLSIANAYSSKMLVVTVTKSITENDDRMI
jgi:hypothetical protein